MNHNSRNGISIVLLLSSLHLIGCADQSEGDPDRVVLRQAEEAAVVKSVDAGAMTTAPDTGAGFAASPFAKILAFQMSVDQSGGVTLKNPRVQYGEPPNQLANPPMFTAQLLDSLGTPIFTVDLWDPRWTFVWDESEQRDFVDLAAKADVEVIVPFRPNVTTIRLAKGRESVATIDVSQVVEAFCAKNRDDPDCVNRPGGTPPIR